MTGTPRAIPHLESTMSVDEVLRRHPTTIAVFNEFAIDACCGGARTIRDAAREDGSDCCALLAALEMALAEEAS